MWTLDRLSNHASPNTAQPGRNFSPTPRRSTQGPYSRPSLSARSSTVSLVSNDSSTKVPQVSRQVSGGSGLKNQINNDPPPDVEDPIKVLERIVGDAIKHEKNVITKHGPSKRPENLVEDISFNGLSLEEYAKQERSTTIEAVPNSSSYSEQSIEEYEKDKNKFEDLHKSIHECDDVLQSVEKYLSSFQADLAAVSTEIESLQSRSTALNSRLETRKEVEKLLGPVIERITLPPNIVKKISEGTIDEAWINALQQLQERSQTLENTKESEQVFAMRDLKPLIEDLSNKATERIRDYFAAQIRALRSPNINAQLIQQQGFLKFKPLFSFLAVRQPQLAEEIAQAYVNTMRWYYHTHFGRYQASLARLKIYATDKHDVLGEEPTNSIRNRSTTSGQSSTTGASQQAMDMFNLGRRSDILRTIPQGAMPAHAAEESKAFHHIETPFFAFNQSLIDNASFEYTFLSSFLTTPHALITQQTIAKHFSTIFSPIFTLGNNLTKQLTSESYDALGILILVRLTQHLAFVAQRRKIPTLENYINGTLMSLWPRFQQILDAHCTSVKSLTSSLPTRSTSGASGGSSTSAARGINISNLTPSNTSTTSSPNNTSTTNSSSIAPHPLTQRFSLLAAGICTLSNPSAFTSTLNVDVDIEPVSNSLKRLRTEFEAFLNRYAQGQFGSGERARKERKAFLSGNYGLILAIVGEGSSGGGRNNNEGKLGREMRERFEGLREEVV